MLLSEAPAFDVVGLGYCSWDYVGVIERIPAFDSPTVSLLDFSSSGGGPVATALVTLARLGIRTGYIGVVGDDQPGAEIKATLEQEGVDLAHLQVEEGARSPICMVLVQKQTGQRSIQCYRGTRREVELQAAHHSYVTAARFLHLDGHHIDAAISAAQWMRQAGRTVVFDANKPRPRLEELLPWVDVLITDSHFPEAYTGHHKPLDAAKALLQMGAQLVVTTLGDKGCMCFTRDRMWYVPGFTVPVVDTTGAGDAFHGAFIYGLLQEWTILRTAEFANAVAALNCTALGGQSALPSLEQALSFLHSTGRWKEQTRPG